MVGYSRQWRCDFAQKTAPLRRLIHSVAQQELKGRLVWDDDSEQAFEYIKVDLCTALALATPNNFSHMWLPKMDMLMLF